MKRAGYLILGAVCAFLCAAVTSPGLLEEPVAGVTRYGLMVALSIVIAFAVWQASTRRSHADHPSLSSPAAASLLAVCSFLGARVLYCLIRLPYYLDTGIAHVLFTREGGFLLYGAILGMISGAALLARKNRLSIPAILNDLTIPGLTAIVICRLGEGFAREGLGTWVENEKYARFPFAVQNPYGEYQWALFFLEALYALLLIWFLCSSGRHRAGKDERMVTALFLYAAAQIFFESLRKDSSLKIGFVRVSQVLSAASILAVILLRNRNMKKILGFKVMLCAICLTAIGIIEWALDKTELNIFLLYAGMVLFCAVLVWTGRKTALPEQKQHS